MKTVIFSFAVMALMLISSAANAQCSSCGQQATVAPVTFNQPIVNQPIVNQPIAYAQPATTGCSSCGTAGVTTFAAQPEVISYAAPVETSYVAQSSGCSSCGQAAYVAPATTACCCGETSRGGLFGGRANGVSSRLIRGGIFSSIRDNN